MIPQTIIGYLREWLSHYTYRVARWFSGMTEKEFVDLQIARLQSWENNEEE